jgi:hypothetical protein
MCIRRVFSGIRVGKYVATVHIGIIEEILYAKFVLIFRDIRYQEILTGLARAEVEVS